MWLTGGESNFFLIIKSYFCKKGLLLWFLWQCIPWCVEYSHFMQLCQHSELLPSAEISVTCNLFTINVFGGLPENCLATHARDTGGIASGFYWNYCIKPLNCKDKASLCIICQLNTVVVHNFNFKSFAEVLKCLSPLQSIWWVFEENVQVYHRYYPASPLWALEFGFYSFVQ